ncbi:hypothetical protein QL093DRAFT_2374007 [Fusarium oxysporum]|nr:hypothetical protein QL093DRAFT_2374007 [Fusarium oxysporum]
MESPVPTLPSSLATGSTPLSFKTPTPSPAPILPYLSRRHHLLPFSIPSINEVDDDVAEWGVLVLVALTFNPAICGEIMTQIRRSKNFHMR